MSHYRFSESARYSERSGIRRPILEILLAISWLLSYLQQPGGDRDLAEHAQQQYFRGLEVLFLRFVEPEFGSIVDLV